jgi:hypothetical protein
MNRPIRTCQKSALWPRLISRVLRPSRLRHSRPHLRPRNLPGAHLFAVAALCRLSAHVR